MKILNRRQFLLSAGKGLVGLSAGFTMLKGCSSSRTQNLTGKIITVNGPIDPGELGTTLPHEHVLVDFIGAEQVGKDRYDADDAFQRVLPYLQEVRELGCDTLIECTPAYIGRDAELCRRLADASGVKLLTNTGYYGAAGDKFVPPYAYNESAEDLAARWTLEWENGIGETGIYPGFIKIGVDDGPLSDIDAKIVNAGALAHKQTGLLVACHTGNGAAALEELDIFEKHGVHGSALIWVHAQNEKNTDIHLEAAERGMWVEFDGVRPGRIQEMLNFVNVLRDAGYLDQVLLSHDAGWYSVGEENGGDFRDYNLLFTEFIPALEDAGYARAEIEKMIIDNPRQAFSIEVRA
jgi:phosphotriesterase-related protein